MTEDRIGDVIEHLDELLQGQLHLFCALADALDRSGCLEKSELKSAVRAKIEWLERCNASIGVATPLLTAEDWLTSPPPDPANPYEGQRRPILVKPD